MPGFDNYHPTYLGLRPGDTITVKNTGSVNLLYQYGVSNGSTISATAFDGTCTPGAQVAFTQPVWVLSAAPGGQGDVVVNPSGLTASHVDQPSSGATSIVVVSVPTVLSTPSISGSTLQGQTLSLNQGVWSDSGATLTQQWYRNGTTLIAGATGTAYVTVAADVGFSISAQVTATNSAGSSLSVTAGTAPVTPLSIPAGSVPQVISVPVVSGTAVQGQVLSTTNGTWSGSPSSFTYQWQSAGANIGGATASTYTLQASDVGNSINVVVVASNVTGASLPSGSLSVGPVVGQSAPVNTVLPKITGTAVQGGALSVSTGTWAAQPAVSGFTYQWFRVPISGGAAAIVQTKAASNGSASPTAATPFGGNTTAGNAILVIAMAKSSAATPSVTSISGGGTYNKIGSVSGFANTLDLEFWLATAITGGSTTGPTVTWTGSSFQATSLSAVAIELSGGITGVDGSQIVGQSGNSGTAAVGTLTPSVNGDVAILAAALSAVASATPGSVANSGWSDQTGAQTFNSNINPWDFQLLASTSAVAGVSWTQAANYWATLGVLLKTTASSPASIGGATSSTYTPVVGDLNSALTCQVTATNAIGNATVSAPSTAAVVASATPVSQFADALNETSLPATFTTATGSSTSTTGGLQVNCLITTGSAVASASQFSILGSSVYAQVAVPAFGSGTKQHFFAVADGQVLSTNNWVGLEVWANGGGSYFVRGALKQAGVFTGLTAVAYNPATMPFLQIRETAGTLYFEYSTDTKNWTLIDSSTYTIPAATLQSMFVVMESLSTGAESASFCTYANLNTPAVVNSGGFTPPGPYQTLVWNDEFTGTSLDGTKWAVLNSAVSGTQGVGGGIAFVTDTNHVAVGNFGLPDGSSANCLKLTTTSATSAAWIQTNKNYDGTTNAGPILAAFDHGTTLARIWMPPGEGMWPSFWKLNTSKKPIFGTNQSPEIDDVEMLMGVTSNHSNTAVYQSTHYPSNTGLTQTYSLPSSASAGWHIYGSTFSSATGNVTFYVDGVQTHTSNGNTILSSPNNLWYLILVCGPGYAGSWAGAPPANLPYPQNMYVDWVRVYQ